MANSTSQTSTLFPAFPLREALPKEGNPLLAKNLRFADTQNFPRKKFKKGSTSHSQARLSTMSALSALPAPHCRPPLVAPALDSANFDSPKSDQPLLVVLNPARIEALIIDPKTTTARTYNEPLRTREIPTARFTLRQAGRFQRPLNLKPEEPESL